MALFRAMALLINDGMGFGLCAATLCSDCGISGDYTRCRGEGPWHEATCPRFVAAAVNWVPLEGLPKQKRAGPGTHLAKKRADHRNAILKDWAEKFEAVIVPRVPDDYTSPFDTDKCAYCLTREIGPSGDEFRPLSQYGRFNKVNCIPCCGRCNSSKQDKCGQALLRWIKEENPKKRTPINSEQQEKIISWWQTYERYLFIPPETYDSKTNKTYDERVSSLDAALNEWYVAFM